MSRFRNAIAASSVAAAAALAAALTHPARLEATSPRIPFTPPLLTGARGVPLPRQSLLELAAVPGSVPRARRHARQVLSEWDLGPLGDPAELVVSELVTNAIRASRAVGTRQPVRLWLAADRARVAIGVWDGSPDPPVPAQARDTDESGRGLFLVEAVSTAWDWYRQDGGKIVRALLDPDARLLS
jgi:anti-sigma regulatory factor (Ser/Thr protein kinase)